MTSSTIRVASVLMARDRLVIGRALREQIPVAVVLAGGYAMSVEDTITIHANTARVAKEEKGLL